MSTTKQDKGFEEVMKDQVLLSVSFEGSALDTAIDFISSNFSPEDVFSEKDLEYWAEKNGYVKE
jgi:hypothetical protein